MADLDFAQAKTRREQIDVACKHHRGYESRKRFTYDAIARFMGIAQGASIERQFHKSLSSTGHLGTPPLLLSIWSFVFHIGSVVVRFSLRSGFAALSGVPFGPLGEAFSFPHG
jgi:hypothetical protein